MSGSFLDKVQAEAKKGTGAEIIAAVGEENKSTLKAPVVSTPNADAVGILATVKPDDTNKSITVSGDHTVLHAFKKAVSKKMNSVDQAMEAMASAFVAAMSEANISTINSNVFGPLVAYSSLVPTGFTRYSPDFLDGSWFVLEHSNRVGQVHKIIADAYAATDSTTLAFPFIQRTRLTMNMYGSKQKIEADYLLFSEAEIQQISLPYVKELRIESDGNTLFLVIEVTR